MDELQQYLNQLGPGPLPEASHDSLISLLTACWDDFEGSNATSMKGHKLSRGIEEASWNPPDLSFVIERHGGTVLGSSRAERQRWTLDLDAKTAHSNSEGYRQLSPASPKLNVSSIANEVADLILRRREDERLRWKTDGSVLVVISNVIPNRSPKGVRVPQQTLAGRRKRFREALTQKLEPEGWQMIRANLYAPGEVLNGAQRIDAEADT